jgi:hypothetical protein
VNAPITRPSPAPFVVPVDEVHWCALLAEALSVACILPESRIDDVRALLNAPPPVMLPNAWDDLMQAARAWLLLDASEPLVTPAFKGQRLIEAALRDKPVPVPSWAERFK